MTDTYKAAKWQEFILLGLLVVAGIAILVRNVESSDPAYASALPQLTFKNPGEAATALATAAKNDDEKALVQILGGETKALLSTGAEESDKAAMDAFAVKFQQMNRWVDMSDGSRVLYIGADNFAFPVPLAKNSSGQWYFDPVAGAEELRAREIGRNELLAIDACSALATAQEVYFNEAGETPQYAQLIISTPGKHDGLYWPSSDTELVSPVGHLSQFPAASLVAAQPGKPFVIDGYSFRILTAQGEEARDGARGYIENGRMVGGFAILATPVKYAESGIMTFMISREGMVYERDFGPDTAKLAGAIQQYNPDENWSLVE
ncbi:MAG TPA: DUF2950 family protein [Candidatus Saccharimonadales bacterium]|nr:DUF2950 family protein [Candidatus Saccharimonadales bacterium]